jgi:hypothetical protein
MVNEPYIVTIYILIHLIIMIAIGQLHPTQQPDTGQQLLPLLPALLLQKPICYAFY